MYILLDALDESPQKGSRVRVLDALDAMRKWDEHRLHLFVTSWDEPDIRKSLNPLPCHQIKMQSSEIDKDISAFISDRLKND